MHNFEDKVLVSCNPVDKPLFISLIRVYFFQTACFLFDINQKLLSTIAFLHGSGRYQHKNEETKRINNAMSLASFDLFRAIVATFFTCTRRFDTLTVDTHDTWLWLFTKFNANSFTETIIDGDERPIVDPFVKIVTDTIPCGKIMGNNRHWQPVFDRYKSAFTISRVSMLRFPYWLHAASELVFHPIGFTQPVHNDGAGLLKWGMP